jgi:hypothetical protein
MTAGIKVAEATTVVPVTSELGGDSPAKEGGRRPPRTPAMGVIESNAARTGGFQT